MSKDCIAVCRLCRSEGEKLFLKGERCYTSKCAVERREGKPGQHGKNRGKFSEYKQQLREKQKVKRLYGLRERQFRNAFEKAAVSRGVTGTELLVGLERRLDNMVFRMGFGSSRGHSRQLVAHGLVRVNGKKVDRPSFQVKAGDIIEMRAKSKDNVAVKAAIELAQSRSIPNWLSFDRENGKATVLALPTREQITHPMREQLIVELYNK